MEHGTWSTEPHRIVFRMQKIAENDFICEVKEAKRKTKITIQKERKKLKENELLNDVSSL